MCQIIHPIGRPSVFVTSTNDGIKKAGMYAGRQEAGTISGEDGYLIVYNPNWIFPDLYSN